MDIKLIKILIIAKFTRDLKLSSIGNEYLNITYKLLAVKYTNIVAMNYLKFYIMFNF